MIDEAASAKAALLLLCRALLHQQLVCTMSLTTTPPWHLFRFPPPCSPSLPPSLPHSGDTTGGDRKRGAVRNVHDTPTLTEEEQADTAGLPWMMRYRQVRS